MSRASQAWPRSTERELCATTQALTNTCLFDGASFCHAVVSALEPPLCLPRLRRACVCLCVLCGTQVGVGAWCAARHQRARLSCACLPFLVPKLMSTGPLINHRSLPHRVTLTRAFHARPSTKARSHLISPARARLCFSPPPRLNSVCLLSRAATFVFIAYRLSLRCGIEVPAHGLASSVAPRGGSSTVALLDALPSPPYLRPEA